MTPLAAIAVAAAIAAAPGHGTVIFRGAVVQGQAGGDGGIGVPAGHRRTITKFGISIRIVGGCDIRSKSGRMTTLCDTGTVPPRVVITPGGLGVEITTIYF